MSTASVADSKWMILQTKACKRHLDTDSKPSYQARHLPLALVFELGIYLNLSLGKSISLIPHDPSSSTFNYLLVQLFLVLATLVAKC